MHEANSMLHQLVDIHPNFDEDMRMAAEAIKSPGYFADFVASSAIMDYKNKQTVLEAITSRARLEKLIFALGEELMILQCEREIQKTVREKIDKNQKDYFLREQIKALQSELGEFEEDDELKEYDEKISALEETLTVAREALWLTDKFSEGEYRDIPGLCKAATLAEIEEKYYSLTPGAYVGVAAQEDDGVDFAQRMKEIHAELLNLQAQSNELMQTISRNMEGLGL